MAIPDIILALDETQYALDREALNLELYIRMEDGQPVDHPVLGGNLRKVIGNFEYGCAPDGWAAFKRRHPPGLHSLYKKEKEQYIVQEDGVVTDNWVLVDMDEQEAEEERIKLAEQFNIGMAELKEEAQSTINALTEENDTVGVNEWQNYLACLEECESAGFGNMNVPKRPLKKLDGSGWVTLATEGVPPDVIK
jgi:hypothetical protein